MNATVDSLPKSYELCVKLVESIDFGDASFKIALFLIAFNPIFWNAVSRLEYYTHFLTKLTKSAKRGCYTFAITIFSLGIIRNYFFEKALHNQVTSAWMESEITKIIGMAFIIMGQILVLSSMYQLGIIGTYCGDYFGILMKDRITSFPFNICYNPMYRGSTLSFLGFSLMYAKPAGLFITLCLHFIYDMALKIEEPFTVKIYAAKTAKKR